MSEVTLICGDCLDVLPGLAAGSVDLAFIDIPYGLGVADWDIDISGLESFALVRSLLSAGGSIYATCTSHIIDTVKPLMKVRRVIPWCKPNLPLRKTLNEWEWSVEFVLWETKGDPRVFNKPGGENARDYWRIPVENGFLNTDKLMHPARKPLSLLRRIIRASTNPGDTVLDPFMGSGTTGVACVLEGRNFIGIEIDPGYFAIAERRIADARAQLPLLPMAELTGERERQVSFLEAQP